MIVGTCVNCKYAGRPTYKSPCSECKGYRKHEAVEIRTNGDRIRAMSDEELADFLGQYKFCDMCVEGCDACTYYGECEKRLLEWLKQPESKEEQNEQVYHKSGYSGLHG